MDTMTFKEYYEYYLTIHQNKWCRRLHIVGQAATVAFVVGAVYHQLWAALIAAPFVVYPFAWTGHFVFEKNMPAAFTHPLWAKASDWVMLKDILTGKIEW
jgi:hypothetical protein|tara:strand:- start:580 stop:879 length:300 start_codon:yes stop_codon:yes gene_type:complete